MKTDERVQGLLALEGMARYLAKKYAKEQMIASGRRRLEIDPVELHKAAQAYLNEHRARLREEARAMLNKV